MLVNGIYQYEESEGEMESAKYYGRETTYTTTTWPKPPKIDVPDKLANWNWTHLKDILLLGDIEEVAQYCEEHLKLTVERRLWDNPLRRHALIDRGSNVLGVAHCDTVSKVRHFGYTQDKSGLSTYIFAPTLDDHLGLFILLSLLPSQGIKHDILLTTNEETGASTAEYFRTEKQYHHLVQFDRAGEDAVYYNYSGDGWLTILDQYFATARGSFSDICKLEHLGCKGVNIGTGYHNNHSEMAYAHTGQVLRNTARYMKFLEEKGGVRYEHQKRFQETYERAAYDHKGAGTVEYHGTLKGNANPYINPEHPLRVGPGNYKNGRYAFVWKQGDTTHRAVWIDGEFTDYEGAEPRCHEYAAFLKLQRRKELPPPLPDGTDAESETGTAPDSGPLQKSGDPDTRWVYEGRSRACVSFASGFGRFSLGEILPEKDIRESRGLSTLDFESKGQEIFLISDCFDYVLNIKTDKIYSLADGYRRYEI